jgi:hypothetical protein
MSQLKFANLPLGFTGKLDGLKPSSFKSRIQFAL